ncbi:hypothetical protein L7F22_011130 [Adiantum nelumboides]|nr:hypothetical protein [Adiantum nelumboides]
MASFIIAFGFLIRIIFAADVSASSYLRLQHKYTELAGSSKHGPMTTDHFEYLRSHDAFRHRRHLLGSTAFPLGGSADPTTAGYNDQTKGIIDQTQGIAIMAHRPDDVTEEVSSSQGQQTYEVGNAEPKVFSLSATSSSVSASCHWIMFKSLLRLKHRLYFTELQIGTPASLYYAQVDTGSDVLWLGCTSCRNCPSKSNLGVKLRPYDPSDSETSSELSCTENLCTTRCVDGNLCLYQLAYGDGSTSEGYLVKDILELPSLKNFSASADSATITFGNKMSLLAEPANYSPDPIMFTISQKH